MEGFNAKSRQLLAVVEEYYPDALTRNMVLDLLTASHNITSAIQCQSRLVAGQNIQELNGTSKSFDSANWLAGMPVGALANQQTALYSLAVIHSYLWDLLKEHGKEIGVAVNAANPFSLTSRQAWSIMIAGSPEPKALLEILRDSEKLKERCEVSCPPPNDFCAKLLEGENSFKGIYETSMFFTLATARLNLLALSGILAHEGYATATASSPEQKAIGSIQMINSQFIGTSASRLTDRLPLLLFSWRVALRLLHRRNLVIDEARPFAPEYLPVWASLSKNAPSFAESREAVSRVSEIFTRFSTTK
jgi:hypothetical protein